MRGKKGAANKGPIKAAKERSWKVKHTPAWGLKKEREHEAANPGPSISEALKKVRPDAWTDPSERKVRQACGSDAKRRKLWDAPEPIDEEDYFR